MRFRTEQDLYNQVSDRLQLAYYLETAIEEKDGRSVHLVGEMHGSRDAIDHVHNEIVPLVKQDPSRWLILREGYGGYRRYGDVALLRDVPDHFYFIKLPNVMGVPIEDALGNVFSKEIKDYILKNSPLTEEDINLWLMITIFQMNSSLSLEERLAITHQKLKKPADYILRLASSNPSEDILIDLHEKLMRTWNQHAKERFGTLVEKHSKRDRILVSIGAGHLPAFSNKYNNIGLR